MALQLISAYVKRSGHVGDDATAVHSTEVGYYSLALIYCLRYKKICFVSLS